MHNVFRVENIPVCITQKLDISRGVITDQNDLITETIGSISESVFIKRANGRVDINLPHYSMTLGKQNFQPRRSYKRSSESNLWRVTTPIAINTDNIICNRCDYKHPRRVCPLVMCRRCATFGHSQHICPIRRIRSQKNINYT